MYISWCIMHVHKLYNISNKSIQIPNKLGSSEKIQYIPTNQNQPNQPPWKKNPSNSSPTRSSWAEIQYFEGSSLLICVDRTRHDPPGYSLGETISAWPEKNALLKGPGPWKYVPAAAKQRGCLPISLYLLLSITQIHAWSLMKTCWTNMCKG